MLHTANPAQSVQSTKDVHMNEGQKWCDRDVNSVKAAQAEHFASDPDCNGVSERTAEHGGCSRQYELIKVLSKAQHGQIFAPCYLTLLSLPCR